MPEFTFHSLESAPEGSKEILETAESEYSFIPNLLRVLAESPAALRSYWSLGEGLKDSSLTPMEQQVLLLAVSRINRCPYCIAAHSLAARLAGMSDEDLDAIRSGKPISDPKLEALRSFASAVTEKRGWVEKENTKEILSVGFTKAQVLEMMLGIAYKTMSNYTNHVVGTLLDEEYKQMEWRPTDTK